MSATLGSLTSALQSYIVAPLNAFGLGGYVFDLEGEGTTILKADITDHYTEDNKATQDHIAINPKRITLRGYVGELLANPNSSGSSGVLQQVTQKLTEITAFLPQLSASATQLQTSISSAAGGGNLSDAFSSAIPAAANIYGLVQSAIGTVSGDTQRQQSAYQYFASCWQQGVLMGIQTPWEFLTNMAIETIVAVQGEDSIFSSDFAVTYKQMRISQTQTTTALSGTGGTTSPGGIVGQGATGTQLAGVTNQGATPGATLPNSSLPGSQSNLINGSSFSSNLSSIYQYH